MSAGTTLHLESLGLSAPCIEVLRHLWDYLDEEMTAASSERLRDHIAGCAQCREYEAWQSCFLEAASQLKAQLGAPATLREKLAAKLKGEGCACWSKARQA